jgi:hypothetical protein
VETPGPQTLQTAAALPAMIGQLPWYCQFASIGMSSLSQAMTLWVRYVGQTRALRAALAAERYRLANDRWPDRLENLVPQFIDAVPIDPVDNRPIRYAVISEGIKTWTIAGDDQNLDDGGDVRRLEPRDPNIRPKDYGWIILIPSLRYRPAEGDTKHPVSSSQSAGESNRD